MRSPSLKATVGVPATIVGGTSLTPGTVVLADQGGRIALSNDGGVTFELIPLQRNLPLTSITDAGAGRLAVTGSLRRDGRRARLHEVNTMAAPASIEAMPVVRDLKDFDLKSGNRLERLIFNNRVAVMLACLVVTVVLGYMAAQVSLNASYEKMLPIGHPYIQNYAANKSQLRGLGNTLRVVVENTQGDIFDPAIPRHPEAGQRRAVPDPGRRSRLGQVHLDAGGPLQRGHRGGLRWRPGHAGHLRRLQAIRRASCGRTS